VFVRCQVYPEMECVVTVVSRETFSRITGTVISGSPAVARYGGGPMKLKREHAPAVAEGGEVVSGSWPKRILSEVDAPLLDTSYLGAGSGYLTGGRRGAGTDYSSETQSSFIDSDDELSDHFSMHGSPFRAGKARSRAARIRAAESGKEPADAALMLSPSGPRLNVAALASIPDEETGSPGERESTPPGKTTLSASDLYEFYRGRQTPESTDIAFKVSVEDFVFRPDRFTTTQGSTIQFTFHGKESVLKLNCVGEFEGVALGGGRGAIFTHTFNRSGEFVVVNEIFSFMKCTIQVSPKLSMPTAEAPSHRIALRNHLGDSSDLQNIPQSNRKFPERSLEETIRSKVRMPAAVPSTGRPRVRSSSGSSGSFLNSGDDDDEGEFDPEPVRRMIRSRMNKGSSVRQSRNGNPAVSAAVQTPPAAAVSSTSSSAGQTLPVGAKPAAPHLLGSFWPRPPAAPVASPPVVLASTGAAASSAGVAATGREVIDLKLPSTSYSTEKAGQRDEGLDLTSSSAEVTGAGGGDQATAQSGAAAAAAATAAVSASSSASSRSLKRRQRRKQQGGAPAEEDAKQEHRATARELTEPSLQEASKDSAHVETPAAADKGLVKESSDIPVPQQASANDGTAGLTPPSHAENEAVLPKVTVVPVASESIGSQDDIAYVRANDIDFPEAYLYMAFDDEPRKPPEEFITVKKKRKEKPANAAAAPVNIPTAKKDDTRTAAPSRPLQPFVPSDRGPPTKEVAARPVAVKAQENSGPVSVTSVPEKAVVRRKTDIRPEAPPKASSKATENIVDALKVASESSKTKSQSRDAKSHHSSAGAAVEDPRAYKFSPAVEAAEAFFRKSKLNIGNCHL
jgi:plastocyanin